ncbi:unknown [Parabacteroides merdae CAG:48]|nr:unknown [Parabacteroides merdae CAG:48]
MPILQWMPLAYTTLKKKKSQNVCTPVPMTYTV